MKKYLALILVMVLVLSLVACSGSAGGTETGDVGGGSSQGDPSPKPDPTPETPDEPEAPVTDIPNDVPEADEGAEEEEESVTDTVVSGTMSVTLANGTVITYPYSYKEGDLKIEDLLNALTKETGLGYYCNYEKLSASVVKINWSEKSSYVKGNFAAADGELALASAEDVQQFMNDSVVQVLKEQMKLDVVFYVNGVALSAEE